MSGKYQAGGSEDRRVREKRYRIVEKEKRTCRSE